MFGPRGEWTPETAERIAQFRAEHAELAKLAEDPAAIPVICLHGTVAGPECFNTIARELRSRGRLVFSLSYGNRGTNSLAVSTEEIADAIRDILEQTGARQVDIVGHSQGGYQAMLLLTTGALAPAQVRRIVSISGSFRGMPHPRWLPRPLARLVAGDAFAELLMRAPGQLPQAPEGAPPLLSIATRKDLVVPVASSLIDDTNWPAARTIILDGHAHHNIFAADEVVELVTSELAAG